MQKLRRGWFKIKIENISVGLGCEEYKALELAAYCADQGRRCWVTTDRGALHLLNGDAEKKADGTAPRYRAESHCGPTLMRRSSGHGLLTSPFCAVADPSGLCPISPLARALRHVLAMLPHGLLLL